MHLEDQGTVRRSRWRGEKENSEMEAEKQARKQASKPESKQASRKPRSKQIVRWKPRCQARSHGNRCIFILSAMGRF